jgi:hypothetical protein
MENLNSDIPLESIAEDKFNRYPFAQRIAKTILSRTEKDGLVIGIYVLGEKVKQQY